MTRGKSKDISPVRKAVHLGGSTDTEGTKFHQGWCMKGGCEGEESRRTQALEPPHSDIVRLRGLSSPSSLGSVFP